MSYDLLNSLEFDSLKYKWGIYSITDKYLGKIYIGKSQNIKSRWHDHLRDLRAGLHHNIGLQDAFNLRGLKNLVWDVIEFLPEHNKTDLCYRELWHIYQHQPNELFNAESPKNYVIFNLATKLRELNIKYVQNCNIANCRYDIALLDAKDEIIRLIDIESENILSKQSLEKRKIFAKECGYKYCSYEPSEITVGNNLGWFSIEDIISG